MDVSDDGRGGAVANPGGGLQGLSDRVAAAGGTLAIVSDAGSGTSAACRGPMRLVIADDSAVVRDGLLHALQAHGHEVVGTAADGAELLACVQRERPQVALIDIRMPPTHTSEGLDAASTIRKRAPDVAVLVLSHYVDADYALTLLRESPARSGYVLKDQVRTWPHCSTRSSESRAARPWSIRSSSSCC